MRSVTTGYILNIRNKTSIYAIPRQQKLRRQVIEYFRRYGSNKHTALRNAHASYVYI